MPKGNLSVILSNGQINHGYSTVKSARRMIQQAVNDGTIPENVGVYIVKAPLETFVTKKTNGEN